MPVVPFTHENSLQQTFELFFKGLCWPATTCTTWRTAWHHHQMATSSHAAGKGWNDGTAPVQERNSSFPGQFCSPLSVYHLLYLTTQSEWSNLLINTAFNDAGISLGWWRKESEMPATVTDHQAHHPCSSTFRRQFFSSTMHIQTQ